MVRMERKMYIERVRKAGSLVVLALALIFSFFTIDFFKQNEKIGAIQVEHYAFASALSNLSGIVNNPFHANRDILAFLELNGISRDEKKVGPHVDSINEILQNPVKVNSIFQKASLLENVSQDIWVKPDNDLGYALFVLVAFSLFGISVNSLAILAFLLFSISVLSLYYFSHDERFKEHGVLLAFLAVFAFTTTSVLQSVPNQFSIENFTYYNQRSLDFLILIPVIHIWLWSLNRPKFYSQDWIVLIIQCLIFAFSIQIRGTGKVFLLFTVGLALTFTAYILAKRLILIFESTNGFWWLRIGIDKNQWCALNFRSILIVSILALASFIFQGYQRYNLQNDVATGSHGIWHNLVISLSLVPESYEKLNVPKEIKGDAFTEFATRSHVKKFGYNKDKIDFPYWIAGSDGDMVRRSWHDAKETISKEIYIEFVKNEPKIFFRSFIKKFQNFQYHLKNWLFSASSLHYFFVITNFSFVVFGYVLHVLKRNDHSVPDTQKVVVILITVLGISSVPQIVFYPSHFLMHSTIFSIILVIGFSMLKIIDNFKKISLVELDND